MAPTRRAVARRVSITAAILLALAAVALAIVFVAKRPDQDETNAASAAKVAIFDTDPDPGTNTSCKFDPDISLIVFNAHYDCIARHCSTEVARLQITDQLFGGWSFRVTSGGRLGAPSSGNTVIGETHPSRVDPDDCR
jgi:hypothetical protein